MQCLRERVGLARIAGAAVAQRPDGRGPGVDVAFGSFHVCDQSFRCADSHATHDTLHCDPIVAVPKPVACSSQETT
jgi:hypothetical protein